MAGKLLVPENTVIRHARAMIGHRMPRLQFQLQKKLRLPARTSLEFQLGKAFGKESRYGQQVPEKDAVSLEAEENSS